MKHKPSSVIVVVLAATLCASPMSAQTLALSPLGRAIRLADGTSLMAELRPARDSLVDLDNRTDQRLLGPVLWLAIANGRSAPVTQRFTSFIDGKGTVEIHYSPLDGGPLEVHTGAHELAGGRTGIQSVLRGGGISLQDGNCTDYDPVELLDERRNHIGIVTEICTRPGETDRVRFYFPRPTRPSRATVIVKCAACPPTGLQFDAGEQRR